MWALKGSVNDTAEMENQISCPISPPSCCGLRGNGSGLTYLPKAATSADLVVKIQPLISFSIFSMYLFVCCWMFSFIRISLWWSNWCWVEYIEHDMIAGAACDNVSGRDGSCGCNSRQSFSSPCGIQIPDMKWIRRISLACILVDWCRSQSTLLLSFPIFTFVANSPQLKSLKRHENRKWASSFILQAQAQATQDWTTSGREYRKASIAAVLSGNVQ